MGVLEIDAVTCSLQDPCQNSALGGTAELSPVLSFQSASWPHVSLKQRMISRGGTPLHIWWRCIPNRGCLGFLSQGRHKAFCPWDWDPGLTGISSDLSLFIHADSEWVRSTPRPQALAHLPSLKLL